MRCGASPRRCVCIPSWIANKRRVRAGRTAGRSASPCLTPRPSWNEAAQCPNLCRFLDAGNELVPHAQLTGVQKAPRHEVAGSLAPAGQRVLWGFDAGADLDDASDYGFAGGGQFVDPVRAMHNERAFGPKGLQCSANE